MSRCECGGGRTRTGGEVHAASCARAPKVIRAASGDTLRLEGPWVAGELFLHEGRSYLALGDGSAVRASSTFAGSRLELGHALRECGRAFVRGWRRGARDAGQARDAREDRDA